MHKNKLIQNNKPIDLRSSYLETPLGTMIAIATNTHLYTLKFTDQSNLKKSIEQIQHTTQTTITEKLNSLLISLQNELNAYFDGKLQQFSIPIQLHGTQFQQQSWKILQETPYGQTSNYHQQALATGNSKAYRAVANANKNNPISIIIPCHRIIKSNGDLSGYNGGIHRKQALLDLEQKNYL